MSTEQEQREHHERLSYLRELEPMKRIGAKVLNVGDVVYIDGKEYTVRVGDGGTPRLLKINK